MLRDGGGCRKVSLTSRAARQAHDEIVKIHHTALLPVELRKQTLPQKASEWEILLWEWWWWC